MKQIIAKTPSLCAAGLCLAMLGCTSPQPEPDPAAIDQEVSRGINQAPPAYLNSLAGIASAPRNDVETAAAITAFQTAYGNSFPELKVALQTGLHTLLQSNPNTPYDGLVFHYGLSNDQKTILYIIGPGVQDPATEYFTAGPFPSGANGQSTAHYLLLDAAAPNAAFRPIDDAEYCRLTDNYYQNMTMTMGGQTNPIRNDPDHPYLVYHQGSELNQFYLDNTGLNPTHLHIAHGADNRNPAATKYHMPYLMFGDGTAPFPLAGDSNPTYLSKALDVGHLCPPFCGKEELPAERCN